MDDDDNEKRDRGGPEHHLTEPAKTPKPCTHPLLWPLCGCPIEALMQNPEVPVVHTGKTAETKLSKHERCVLLQRRSGAECTSTCHNAGGLECTCSCMGEFHGKTHASASAYSLQGKPHVVKWKGNERIARVLRWK